MGLLLEWRTTMRAGGTAAWLAGTLALALGAAAPLQAQDSASPTRRAVVRGRILGDGGQPIEAADVVLDSAWHTRTDADGRFRLAGIPVAVHLMEVRAIGFEPLTLALHVVRAEELRLAITLKAAAQPLPELVVTAHQRRLEDVGYYARRATGRGRFLEGDSLARLHPVNFVRALAQLQGIRVVNPGELDPRLGSTGCRDGFTLIVNGWVVPDEAFFLRTLHPLDIEAVEIYGDGGVPNVSTAALQSRAASAPGTQSALPAGATTALPALGPPPPPQSAVGTSPAGSAVTRPLSRAATRDDMASRDEKWKRHPNPTSCTLVVWERQ